jgi:tetratricopeptide (TPR) repeat protein
MATTAAYQTAVAALRKRKDTSPMETVVRVFRVSADSMSPDAPRGRTLKRLATQLEAMLAHDAGDTERAITLLREIAPTEPSNASLPPTIMPSYELMGSYLLSAGQHAQAVEAFQQALSARANRTSAMRGLERAKTGAK